jgi:hypothetical protein
LQFNAIACDRFVAGNSWEEHMDRDALMATIINELMAQAERDPEGSAEYDCYGSMELCGRFQIDELADQILRALHRSSTKDDRIKRNTQRVA